MIGRLLLPLLLAQVPATTPDGFAVARPGHRFAFPADHGSHPAFRTEWWYWTGHLQDDRGRRYGFQLTFFRQASPKAPWRGSAAFRSDQLHLAHAALTEVDGKRFRVEERLNREGLLAGAAEGGLRVFHGPWEVVQDGAGQRLRLTVEGAVLELKLEPRTAPVIFGEQGVSRKGADPTASSHYVTFPRQAAEGRLALPGELPRPVRGSAWMDHEWSSNQLGADQVGWDWAGLQLDDGRSLMAYRLRRADGGQDPFSSATLVDPGGRILERTSAFLMLPEGEWKSPASGIRYPLPLRLEAFGERWTLVPLLADQELRTRRSNGITYWEGACRVLDAAGADKGRAYLELTGYGGSLKGRF